MPHASLPERPSLEYLKKRAKDRLRARRAARPVATLSEAQREIARQYGFPSWRALKAEVDRRRAATSRAFFEACAAGDLEAARTLLDADPSLVREHEPADHATALHVAAANRHLEIVRLLLDRGADPNDRSDLHRGGPIGWALAEGNDAVVDLLIERGARHHVFSAIAAGDPDLVERIVRADPSALAERRSRFDDGQTPLHAACAPPDGRSGAPRYGVLRRLIALGADLDAPDDRGRTALAVALLRGDREAARLLRAAGAAEPRPGQPAAGGAIADLAGDIRGLVPSLHVPDIGATLAWYTSIGFTEVGRHRDGPDVTFGMVSLGKARVAFGTGPGSAHVRLWFYVRDVEALYERLRERQLRSGDVPFAEDLYAPFYGGRQFSIRDPNGCDLIFYQPAAEPGGLAAQ